MIDSFIPMLADASSDLPMKLGQALHILMMFGFILGTVAIISGAVAIKRGDTENGKLAIVSGIIVAAAPAIMLALFNIFGLDSSVPSFK